MLYFAPGISANAPHRFRSMRGPLSTVLGGEPALPHHRWLDDVVVDADDLG